MISFDHQNVIDLCLYDLSAYWSLDYCHFYFKIFHSLIYVFKNIQLNSFLNLFFVHLIGYSFNLFLSWNLNFNFPQINFDFIHYFIFINFKIFIFINFLGFDHQKFFFLLPNLQTNFDLYLPLSGYVLLFLFFLNLVYLDNFLHYLNFNFFSKIKFHLNEFIYSFQNHFKLQQFNYHLQYLVYFLFFFILVINLDYLLILKFNLKFMIWLTKPFFKYFNLIAYSIISLYFLMVVLKHWPYYLPF